MKLVTAYRGSEAQRFALEPRTNGDCWHNFADEVSPIFVYALEPGQSGQYFVQLLAFDVEAYEVG